MSMQLLLLRDLMGLFTVTAGHRASQENRSCHLFALTELQWCIYTRTNYMRFEVCTTVKMWVMIFYLVDWGDLFEKLITTYKYTLCHNSESHYWINFLIKFLSKSHFWCQAIHHCMISAWNYSWNVSQSSRCAVLLLNPPARQGTVFDSSILFAYSLSPSNPEGHLSLWVGNITQGVTEKQLIELFSR